MPMVINISLSNKAIYLLVGVFILIIAVGLVYAFGGNQPNIMGHTLSEIQMPSCNNGEALIKTVDGWGCGAVGGGFCEIQTTEHWLPTTTINQGLLIGDGNWDYCAVSYLANIWDNSDICYVHKVSGLWYGRKDNTGISTNTPNCKAVCFKNICS
jgi:hypothetical protein